MKKTETETKEVTNGWIELEEFLPARDMFVVKALPQDTEKKTETGIVLSVQESVVEDRPAGGIIMSVGPESKRKVGEFVYWTKQSGYDLNMIRKPADAEFKYVLLYEDALLGNRTEVKKRRRRN
jgi:co-chaperonin GroES (HSP10)